MNSMDKKSTFTAGTWCASPSMPCDRDLEPEFPPHALKQLDAIDGPGIEDGPLVRDHRAAVVLHRQR